VNIVKKCKLGEETLFGRPLVFWK